MVCASLASGRFQVVGSRRREEGGEPNIGIVLTFEPVEMFVTVIEVFPLSGDSAGHQERPTLSVG